MIEIPDSGPWKRIERIGQSVLILGDCRDVVPLLPPIEMMFADPPYNVALGSTAHAVRQTGYFGMSDALNDYDYLALLQPCFSMIAADNCLCVVTPGNSNQSLWPSPKWTMAWLKTNGVTRTPLTRGQKMQHACWEPILIYGKLDTPPHSDVVALPIAIQPDAEGHPCPKPLALIKRLVSYSNAATVLDPFMDSGTTGVACAQLGRKFIGIEIEPKYFDIACERITNAYRQQPMFDSYDEVTRPEQVKLL